jgi:hypothetical protein
MMYVESVVDVRRLHNFGSTATVNCCVLIVARTYLLRVLR